MSNILQKDFRLNIEGCDQSKKYVKIFNSKDDFYLPANILFSSESSRVMFLKKWINEYISKLYKTSNIEKSENDAFKHAISCTNKRKNIQYYFIKSQYKKKIKIDKIKIGTTNHKDHNHKVCAQYKDGEIVSSALEFIDNHFHRLKNKNRSTTNNYHNHNDINYEITMNTKRSD
jgi:hypothetical protein